MAVCGIIGTEEKEMDIKNDRIDHGKPFDWGRTSVDYARYRDIYPDVFYQKIVDRGLCVAGQCCLDIGTGTGVLPRNMARFGAKWTGIDISLEQIEQAKRLSQGMNISYNAIPCEELSYPAGSFDVITACQCFWYFDHERISPILHKMLKDDGRLVVLYMAWLPYEDEIAGKSERIVLKYNPVWTGAGETRHPIHVTKDVLDYFDLEEHEEYDLMVPFTRDSWHGRMRSCRGVGASLNSKDIALWDEEHRQMLQRETPEEFEILHYAAITVLKKKEKNND